MLTHLIDTDQTTTFTISSAGESWLLKDGVTIETVEKPALVMSGTSDNSIITINGTLTASDPGTDSGDFAALISYGTDSFIKVGKPGILDAEVGIDLFASGQELNNHGSITGSLYGIHATANDLDIYNEGTIGTSVLGMGIVISGDENRIVNRHQGVISGMTGIYVNAADGDKTTIFNDGKIGSFAPNPIAIGVADGSTSVEAIHNHGEIDGDVVLGGGDDLFEGLDGKVVGKVEGGEGNDTYVLDKQSDFTISEANGGGYDTIRAYMTYHAQAGSNVEAVILDGEKDFDVFASTDGNHIFGNVGDNQVVGNISADVLGGSTGNDVLTGGGNSDIFIFKTGWDKDTITDFHSGEDTLFLGDWDEIGSFRDLKRHHLSEHDGNLIIQSGGDQLTLEGMHKSELHHSDVAFSLMT